MVLVVATLALTDWQITRKGAFARSLSRDGLVLDSNPCFASIGTVNNPDRKGRIKVTIYAINRTGTRGIYRKFHKLQITLEETLI